MTPGVTDKAAPYKWHRTMVIWRRAFRI